MEALISECLNWTNQWLRDHSIWLGPCIGLFALLESLVVVGILVPGVAILFALGAIAGSGLLEPFPMFAWAFVGAVIGDGMSFQLGYHFRDRVRYFWPFRHNRHWLHRSETFIYDYGGISIVLGRFIGPVRPMIPVVAGMMNMSPARFYIINVLSSIPWAVAYLTPGYLTGTAIKMGIPDSFYSVVSALLCASVALGFIGTLSDDALVKKRRHQSLPLLLLILTFSVLVTLTMMTINENLYHLDQKARLLLIPLYAPVSLHLFEYVTRLGSFNVVILTLVVVCGYLFCLKAFRRLVAVIVTFTGMEASLWLMQRTVDKTRPISLPGIDPYAFPSGHTTQVIFLALVLVSSLILKQKYLIRLIGYASALFCAFLVGLSRLVLEMHWLTDVAAGLLLGAFWFSAYILVTRSNRPILEQR